MNSDPFWLGMAIVCGSLSFVAPFGVNICLMAIAVAYFYMSTEW